MIGFDLVNDDMRADGVDPHGWVKFWTFAGDFRLLRKKVQARRQLADVDIRLIDRPLFGRVEPDCFEIIKRARPQPIGFRFA